MEGHGVYDDGIGFDMKVLHRLVHGLHGGLVNVHRVDFLRRHADDGEVHRFFVNFF